MLYLLFLKTVVISSLWEWEETLSPSSPRSLTSLPDQPPVKVFNANAPCFIDLCNCCAITFRILPDVIIEIITTYLNFQSTLQT